MKRDEGLYAASPAQAATRLTAASNGPWTMTAPCLPPAINHYYSVGANGKRYITEDGRSQRDAFQAWVNTMHFTPDLKKSYELYLAFTVPTWTLDIDSMVKVAMDCIFGSRADHRVVLLLVQKFVVPKGEQTYVTVNEAGTAIRIDRILRGEQP